MPLKIAVIGAGAMGGNHLRVLSDMDDPNAELVAVSDPVEDLLHRATIRYHIQGYADYREMIEKHQPNIVVIAVPTSLHFEVASFALSHGVNVLLEKPIANTQDEAQQLIDLAVANGVILAIGHVERFNPAVAALKERLNAGEAGKIFSLLARRLGPFPPRIRDVGVTLDLSTHDIDVMRYLLEDEVEHVYAETQRQLHQSHEDMLMGMLRFSRGAVGTLDTSWLTPTRVRELSVTGERGMFLVNYLTQDLYFHENASAMPAFEPDQLLSGISEGAMIKLKVVKVEPLRREHLDVIAAVREGRAPTVTGQDGLAALRVAQSLVMSAHEGRIVKCLAKVENS